MRIWNKDNWILLAILVYCFLLAYFTPSQIARLGYLPLLYLAYRSKQNAIWLILLLVFIDNPAYFFYGGEKMAIGRTPLYPLIGGGISFNELLAFTLIFKSLRKTGTNLLYKKELIALVLIILFSFLTSFAYAVTLNAIVITVRRLTMWIFIFSIPRLLKLKHDWLTFFRLLFPFIFLIFIDQIYIFLVGSPIASIFNPEVQTYHAMQEVIIGSEQVSRAISGPTIIFLSFSVSLLFSLNNDLKYSFKPLYLITISIIAYIVILLSATRGWFLSFSIMLLLFFVTSGEKYVMRRYTPYIIPVLIFLSLIISLFPVLQTQLTNAWSRILTLEQVVQGDLTAGGTAQRWTDYLPKLMKYIWESPIGYGFSDTAFNIENDHVGIINPIITLGIIGYLILLIFIFGAMLKLYKLRNHISKFNPYKKSLIITIIFFIGLFVIHITSRQIFGLNINTNYNLLVSIIFAFANWVYIESIKYDHLIIEQEKSIQLK